MCHLKKIEKRHDIEEKYSMHMHIHVQHIVDMHTYVGRGRERRRDTYRSGFPLRSLHAFAFPFELEFAFELELEFEFKFKFVLEPCDPASSVFSVCSMLMHVLL